MKFKTSFYWTFGPSSIGVTIFFISLLNNYFILFSSVHADLYR